MSTTERKNAKGRFAVMMYHAVHPKPSPMSRPNIDCSRAVEPFCGEHGKNPFKNTIFNMRCLIFTVKFYKGTNYFYYVIIKGILDWQ